MRNIIGTLGSKPQNIRGNDPLKDRIVFDNDNLRILFSHHVLLYTHKQLKPVEIC